MAVVWPAWASAIFFLLLIEEGSTGRGEPQAPLSNCGGSTPWKCPYIAFRLGSGCPDASISTPEECRTAVETLGYTIATFQQVDEPPRRSARPSGCSIGYGRLDKSMQLKRDQVYFNKDPVGYKYDRAYLSVCHNRVEMTGSFGNGRDFPFHNEGRGSHGQVENVAYESKCCGECWEQNPGTQMYEYQAGPSQYFSRTVHNLCRCLFKEPGPGLTILITEAVGSTRTTTGICAKDYTVCTPGDNVAGTEMFIQEYQYSPYRNCWEVCQRLYPNSVGITESTVQKYSNGKMKCWCEFGADPQLKEDERYRTCLFNKQF